MSVLMGPTLGPALELGAAEWRFGNAIGGAASSFDVKDFSLCPGSGCVVRRRLQQVLGASEATLNVRRANR